MAKHGLEALIDSLAHDDDLDVETSIRFYGDETEDDSDYE